MCEGKGEGGGVVVNMRWGCRVTPGELLSRVKPLLRRTSSTSSTLSLLATACSSSSSYLKMSCFKPLWRDMAAVDMLLCRRGAIFERAELAMHTQQVEQRRRPSPREEEDEEEEEEEQKNSHREALKNRNTNGFPKRNRSLDGVDADSDYLCCRKSVTSKQLRRTRPLDPAAKLRNRKPSSPSSPPER